MSIHCTAIVAAAGKSRRMRSRTPKIFLEVSGKPIILHTLQLLSRISMIEEIVLVLNSAHIKDFGRRFKKQIGEFKHLKIVPGGPQRPDSVVRGLAALGEKCNVVCIHDAARPNPDPSLIRKAIRTAFRCGAAILAAPVKDTVKQASSSGAVKATLDRNGLYLAQTPQVFRKEIILKAYRNRAKLKKLPTDDAELVEAMGRKVQIIESDYDNIKITTLADLALMDKKSKCRFFS